MDFRRSKSINAFHRTIAKKCLFNDIHLYRRGRRLCRWDQHRRNLRAVKNWNWYQLNNSRSRARALRIVKCHLYAPYHTYICIMRIRLLSPTMRMRMIVGHRSSSLIDIYTYLYYRGVQITRARVTFLRCACDLYNPLAPQTVGLGNNCFIALSISSVCSYV